MDEPGTILHTVWVGGLFVQMTRVGGRRQQFYIYARTYMVSCIYDKLQMAKKRNRGGEVNYFAKNINKEKESRLR